MKNLLLTTCIIWLVASSFSAPPFTMSDVPLLWSDFQIVADSLKTGNYDAYFAYEMPYTAKGRMTKDGKKIEVNISMRLEIDHKRCWVSSAYLDTATADQKQATLNHLKALFIIAMLQHQKLKQELTKYRFSKNVQSEIDTLYSRTARITDSILISYNEVTDFGASHDMEAQWEQILLKELNTTYAGYQKLPLQFVVQKN